MRARKSKTCVICGSRAANTREHVPPKSTFLPPLPSNFITVPACDECNRSFSKDDEHFRVFLGMHAEPGTELQRLWKERVVTGTFRHSRALRATINADREKLLKYAESHPLERTDGGTLSPEETERAVAIDQGRIDAVIWKIVRCLGFHEYGVTYPASLERGIEVVSHCSPEAADIIRQRSTGRVGTAEQFCYLTARDQAQEAWTLLFYNRVAAFVSLAFEREEITTPDAP